MLLALLSVRHKMLLSVHGSLRKLRDTSRLPHPILTEVHLGEGGRGVEIEVILRARVDMRLCCRHVGKVAKMPEEMLESINRLLIVSATRNPRKVCGSESEVTVVDCNGKPDGLLHDRMI